MSYQSLYRRYRPQRFGEVKGQDHVIKALHNAVRDDRVAHCYLFSGPRGTGKTSTARILAKALNCTDLVDGEPCGACDSCHAVERNASLDIFELDAASHNGVDDMRELVASAAISSPGRTKVYILDEVHMLSKAASNALLKTLEDAPSHVVFVLATTDPQKVLPTIRSRAQSYEFGLLPPTVMDEHVRYVIADAGLAVEADAIDYVLRRGQGSARDTLSVLDQVVAAGGAASGGTEVDVIVESLVERDVRQALVGVSDAMAAGRDAKALCEQLLDVTRDVFLAAVAPDSLRVPDADRAVALDRGARMGPAAAVRALEVLGEALLDMRLAPDPRVSLEVALVRLTKPEADVSPAALLERVERLERADRTPAAPAPAASGPPPPPARPGAAKPPAAPPAPAPRAEPQPERPAPPPEPTAAAPQQPAGATSGGPSRDDLTLAWGDGLLAALPGKARSVFRSGRFTAVDGLQATFAVPDRFHLDRCQERKAMVEDALDAHFGVRLILAIVVDGSSATPEPAAHPAPMRPADPPAPRNAPSAHRDAAPPASAPEPFDDAPPPAFVDDDPDVFDPDDLVDVDESVLPSAIDQLREAFGGELVEE